MKTAHQLEEDILAITMTINEQYPELSKFITEMPLKNQSESNPEINTKNLQDYYNSLQVLVKNYIPTHLSEKQ
ncbi:hypothetical protein [Parasediminibacterium sp. JCM 36343]|uniref:hypothetical protein n=1 Tax=Parasediminibacterium sp. JCM 36343 TaxID=3374279 RepID=UPI00397BCFD8